MPLHNRSSMMIFTALVTTMSLTACSPSNFANAPTAAPSTPSSQSSPDSPVAVVPVTPTPAVPPQPVCTPVASITRLTKILFVVDSSGSNQAWVDPKTNYQCLYSETAGCNPPTDSDKAFRYGSIQRFLSQYSNKSNFQWGFISFGNDSVKDYVAGNGKTSFTANPRKMQEALSSFAGSSDSGNTPYNLALTAAANAIANDKDHNTSTNPQYYVVLLTDGYPTDISSPDQAVSQIGSLLSAAPHEVSLSTIFYGTQNVPSSNQAISLLSRMANIGSGQFANVNNPANGINISDVIPGQTCP